MFFTDEEREIAKLAQVFAAKELAPQASTHDENDSFNLDAFKKMGELGILGITADTKYGGANLGAVAATLIMDEFGQTCPGSTLSFLAHTILCVNNIDKNASEQQKSLFLPKLISGEWIGCMGMSEAGYGSDAIGLQTSAKKSSDGSYLLNGSKIWITNANYADIAYVYARTGTDKKNISTFIVEKSVSKFKLGKVIHKMGMRASPTGELVFENVVVPADNLIGEEGQSVYHMMKNLEMERLTIAGISLGIAKACLQQSIKYAQERKQFNSPISNFQLIQKIVAEMSSKVAMMHRFLYSVAYEYDHGKIGPLLPSQVKLLIPKMCTEIALDAIQLHGGYGYSREFSLERLMRDSKLMEIGAGTNEIMVLIIAKELFNLREK